MEPVSAGGAAPTPGVPAAATPTATAATATIVQPRLMAGVTIDVTVLRALAAGRFLVALGGTTFVASSDAELKPGTQVRLNVARASPDGVVLRLAEPVRAEVSAAPQRQAALNLPPGPAAAAVLAAFEEAGAPLDPLRLQAAVRAAARPDAPAKTAQAHALLARAGLPATPALLGVALRATENRLPDVAAEMGGTRPTTTAAGRIRTADPGQAARPEARAVLPITLPDADDGAPAIQRILALAGVYPTADMPDLPAAAKADPQSPIRSDPPTVARPVSAGPLVQTGSTPPGTVPATRPLPMMPPAAAPAATAPVAGDMAVFAAPRTAPPTGPPMAKPPAAGPGPGGQPAGHPAHREATGPAPSQLPAATRLPAPGTSLGATSSSSSQAPPIPRPDPAVSSAVPASNQGASTLEPSSSRPAASDQRPAASGQQPATSGQRPAASGQRPPAANSAPTSSPGPAPGDEPELVAPRQTSVAMSRPDPITTARPSLIREIVRLVNEPTVPVPDNARPSDAPAGAKDPPQRQALPSASPAPLATAPRPPSAAPPPAPSDLAAPAPAPAPPPTALDETVTRTVREHLAEQVFKPKELADYDRVVPLPLSAAQVTTPARLAVASRSTGGGSQATFVRVDAELTRLGPVSIRLSGSDSGGPLAITLIASRRSGAALADELPALVSDLRSLGLDAAVRVVADD